MKSTYIVLKAQRPAMPPGGIRASAMATATHIDRVQVNVDELDRRDIATVRRDADVLHVAPAMPMRLVKPLDVVDAGAAAPTVAWGVQAVKADTSPQTGAGIKVAVLDTGIDASHVAFKDVPIVQKDFTGEGDGDQHGHGTHCAGTIFGRDVQGTRIGVARGVTDVLIGKVLGQNGGGSSDEIMQAVLWAVQEGANVISMSLGMDFPGYVAALQADGMPPELATSRALEGYRANTLLFDSLVGLIEAQANFGKAVLLVAAAGNESRRDMNPDFEIMVSPPAIAKGIVSVAALGQDAAGMTVAPFSNTGARVSGPGVNILSAKAGGGLRTMSGTSMATPHVAGVAALWAERLKVGGRLTASELSDRLVASGRSEGLKVGLDPFDIGAGLVSAPQ